MELVNVRASWFGRHNYPKKKVATFHLNYEFKMGFQCDMYCFVIYIVLQRGLVRAHLACSIGIWEAQVMYFALLK